MIGCLLHGELNPTHSHPLFYPILQFTLSPLIVHSTYTRYFTPLTLVPDIRILLYFIRSHCVAHPHAFIIRFAYTPTISLASPTHQPSLILIHIVIRCFFFRSALSGTKPLDLDHCVFGIIDAILTNRKLVCLPKTVYIMMFCKT